MAVAIKSGQRAPARDAAMVNGCVGERERSVASDAAVASPPVGVPALIDDHVGGIVCGAAA